MIIEDILPILDCGVSRVSLHHEPYNVRDGDHPEDLDAGKGPTRHAPREPFEEEPPVLRGGIFKDVKRYSKRKYADTKYNHQSENVPYRRSGKTISVSDDARGETACRQSARHLRRIAITSRVADPYHIRAFLAQVLPLVIGAIHVQSIANRYCRCRVNCRHDTVAGPTGGTEAIWEVFPIEPPPPPNRLLLRVSSAKDIAPCNAYGYSLSSRIRTEL